MLTVRFVSRTSAEPGQDSFTSAANFAGKLPRRFCGATSCALRPKAELAGAGSVRSSSDAGPPLQNPMSRKTWALRDSNPRPARCKRAALTT